MYKKLSYLLLAVLFLASCDKTMSDVYNDLDAAQVPLHKDVAYTLTKVDYDAISKAALADAATRGDSTLAKAVATTQSLNSFATADKYVPARLAIAFPALNKNSTVQVSYAYSEDYLATLAGAPAYTLTAADYQSVWGVGSTTNYFTPSNSPTAKLPGILKADFPNAVSGDVKLISYNYSDNEPDAVVEALNENYESGFTTGSSINVNTKGWVTKMTAGTKQDWKATSYNGNTYAQVTAYQSNANAALREVSNVIYMITPEIDLTNVGSPKFSFDVCIGSWNYDGLTVLVSLDATAATDPGNATWVNVTSNFTIPKTPTSGYGVLATAGTMDMSAYAGKKVFIAFKYEGGYPDLPATTNARTTTYQIDNILIKGIDKNAAPTPAANPRPFNAIYTYGGTNWTVYPNAVMLNPADYTAMNISTMTAAMAPNYLPTYLSAKFPYAQTGNKEAVVYKSGSSTTAADEYVFTGGLWQPSLVAALTTEQFIHNGEKWLFDPTINLTMVNADYQLICTYVLNDPTLSVYNRVNATTGVPYDNEEWYFGFSGYYGNINFRLSGSASSSRDVPSSKANDTELHSLATNEEKADLLWERLTETAMIKFLQLRYPESPVDAQGVQLYYNISAKVYYPDGVTNTTLIYTFKYKVLTAGSAGTPPTFEFVSVEQQ